MDRFELLFRAGVYFGAAGRYLGDHSYAEMYDGHAEDLTEERYWELVKEIQDRFLEKGLLAADEDLFEKLMSSR